MGGLRSKPVAAAARRAELSTGALFGAADVGAALGAVVAGADGDGAVVAGAEGYEAEAASPGVRVVAGAGSSVMVGAAAEGAAGAAGGAVAVSVDGSEVIRRMAV
ncbi:hypothetical protein ACGFIF_35500 [Kribbella sp. NPDC049174]|uniref:hypothetical protein n=1 Tax=Kribbella sp. NPDC049174 TaxID=3364112 RepID=UPI003721315A